MQFLGQGFQKLEHEQDTQTVSYIGHTNSLIYKH